MNDDQRQSLIVRQTALKAAAYTVGAIAKDAFRDTDAAVAVVKAMAVDYEAFVWSVLAAEDQGEQNDFDKEQPKSNSKFNPINDGKHFCSACGKRQEYREGVSKKTGQPWKALMCPDRDCKGKPVWIREGPVGAMIPGEIPFE